MLAQIEQHHLILMSELHGYMLLSMLYSNMHGVLGIFL